MIRKTLGRKARWCEAERLRQLAQRDQQTQRVRKVVRLACAFKCHVCGVPAMEPRVTWHGDWNEVDLPGGRYGGRFEIGHTDWHTPGDLEKCRECCRWTCPICMEAGMCRKCAERGILWRWLRIG